MFYGNTETDAYSTKESLTSSGGGTCSGYELNRSAYWSPALLDGKGNAVVPEQIILYYKTKQEDQINRMPQGLQLLAGNTTGDSFQVSQDLYWSCGASGIRYNLSNQIPDCNGDTIAATITFPQCWDGVNLESADNHSHVRQVSVYDICPSSHPVRLPQISILLYFPGQESIAGWRLSSDDVDSYNMVPGGTLHADWIGGWNDQTMDLWTDNCVKAGRNCSSGQTGTSRLLARVNNYGGPHFLPVGEK